MKKIVVSLIILIGVFTFSVLNSSAQSSCNVPMKNGTYEMGRCNDLDELAKDWFFFRKMILKANREGNQKKVAKYQRSFQQVNYYLNQYRDADISEALSRNE